MAHRLERVGGFEVIEDAGDVGGFLRVDEFAQFASAMTSSFSSPSKALRSTVNSRRAFLSRTVSLSFIIHLLTEPKRPGRWSDGDQPIRSRSMARRTASASSAII
jgi:hypothetical protein